MAVQNDAEDEWDNFPRLPGTRLSFRRVKRSSNERIKELVSEDGVVWASSRTHRPRMFTDFRTEFFARDATYQLRTVVKPSLLKGMFVAQQGIVVDLVDVITEAPLFRVSGRHYHHKAGGRVQLADQTVFEFPVKGSKRSKATMTAVDDSGRIFIHYRLNRRELEVVAAPIASSVVGIGLLVFLTAGYLGNYFEQGGGGG